MPKILLNGSAAAYQARLAAEATAEALEPCPNGSCDGTRAHWGERPCFKVDLDGIHPLW